MLQKHNGALHDNSGPLQRHNSPLRHDNGAAQRHNGALRHDNKALPHDNDGLHKRNGAWQHDYAALLHRNDAPQRRNDALRQRNGTPPDGNGAPRRAIHLSPEAPLMATWNSGAKYNSGILWGSAATPPLVPNNRNQPIHKTMKRQPYYPRLLANQPEWHFNLADVLEEEGEDMGLLLADVTRIVNDSRHLGYALGIWLTKVREFGPGCTGELETLRHGTGTTAFTLPVFVPPDPPAGLTPVLPGALDRIFRYVQVIKNAPGYTVGLGLLLGIEGPEEMPVPPGGTPPPRLQVSVIPGTAQQIARVKFFKEGHEYVVIESRIGNGAWEQVAMTNKSPFLDDRALLVPGQAEVREYRARFWDNGQPSSEWCPVLKATVSP